MDNPVHDGVRYRLLPDGLVPHLHGDLRGNDGRAGVIPVVNHIHQKTPGDIVKRAQGKVVQDEQVRPLDPFQVPENLPRRFGRFE